MEKITHEDVASQEGVIHEAKQLANKLADVITQEANETLNRALLTADELCKTVHQFIDNPHPNNEQLNNLMEEIGELKNTKVELQKKVGDLNLRNRELVPVERKLEELEEWLEEENNGWEDDFREWQDTHELIDQILEIKDRESAKDFIDEYNLTSKNNGHR